MTTMMNALRRSGPSAMRALCNKQRQISTSSSFTVLQTQKQRPAAVALAHQWIPSRFKSSASAAAVSTKADEKLLSVLDSEINCALNEDVTVPKPPSSFPFEIVDTPGEEAVVLKRVYGNENIKVEVVMVENEGMDADEDDDDENDEESSEEPHVSLSVTITKGEGPALELTCTGYNDEVAIETISLKEQQANSNDRIPYEGPDFQDLDENLQRSFHDYIALRGINTALTKYMAEYMAEKDNREYTKWLKDIKEFVKKL